MTTVLIMAGGTGGHVFPGLAVADVLRLRACKVIWMGTRRGIEGRLVPAAGIPVEWVRVSGLRGKGLLNWLRAPLNLVRAFYDALAVMRRCRPDVVLGLGGFVAGPGGLAARLLGKPLVIHEQNAVAGLTNRLLTRFATVTASAFPDSFRNRADVVVTGNPVRQSIYSTTHCAASTDEPPRLLVFGGSQGAEILNRVVPAALGLLPTNKRPRVLHQAGQQRSASVRLAYELAGVTANVCDFIDDMAAAYAGSDLAVCRSGALTVAELAAAHVPSILVPLPSAVDDHQTANARYLTDRGAALLLPQSDLTPEVLARELLSLLSDASERRRAMTEAAKRAAIPDAAERLADLCLAVSGATL